MAHAPHGINEHKRDVEEIIWSECYGNEAGHALFSRTNLLLQEVMSPNSSLYKNSLSQKTPTRLGFLRSQYHSILAITFDNIIVRTFKYYYFENQASM